MEAAGSTVAKGVVKNKAEKTAFKRLGKAAAKEADNIIPPPAGMGEAFNSVIGTGAKDL